MPHRNHHYSHTNLMGSTFSPSGTPNQDHRQQHYNQGGANKQWTAGGMNANPGATGHMGTTAMGSTYGSPGMGMGGMGAIGATGNNLGHLGAISTMGAPGMGAMGQKFGAGEIIQTHEVLTDHIDGINQFQLYRPFVQDQQLLSILDKQLQHLMNSYDNIVNYLHHRGMGEAVPYRVRKSFQPQYGLRQPQPEHPQFGGQPQLDDKDVASGMLLRTKACAMLCTTAALECADPTLRSMMVNCVVSAINQSYEVFQYMNQKGMYQVPTLQQNTTNTLMNTYQPFGNVGAMQFRQ